MRFEILKQYVSVYIKVKCVSPRSADEYTSLCALYQLQYGECTHLHISAKQHSGHSVCSAHSAAGSQSGCRAQRGGRAAIYILIPLLSECNRSEREA